MEIPQGFSEVEEWVAIRKIQGHVVKDALVDWLLGLAVWEVRADLTFKTLAGPERAEKAVRHWLRRVAPDAFVAVGYERQERGAVHAHLIINKRIQLGLAIALWTDRCGWCRIEAIDSPAAAVAYIVKHAVKDLNVEFVGYPSYQCRLFDCPSRGWREAS
jgi:hypothetical protein